MFNFPWFFLIGSWVQKYPTANFYISKRLLYPGELELIVDESIPKCEPCVSGSWVVFIDFNPDANWSHCCLYLLVDDLEFSHIREIPADWFPKRWREVFVKLDLSAWES